jgi:hypothetical protein
MNAYEPLKTVSCEVCAEDAGLPASWKDYAKEYLWYGRKEQRNIHLDLTSRPIL